MPPDIIKQQQEVARKMLYGLEDGDSTPTYNLDSLIATIIANIGRELEARCEEKRKPLIHDVNWAEGYNASLDTTKKIIRSITSISPTT